MAGFKAAVFSEIRVNVDTQTNLDIRMELGNVTENVTVTGFSPMLKTDRADVATTFDAHQITDLPVLDRNFTKFILLTPGTQQLQWQHAASENPQGSTQTMVNGQHFSGTGYRLDGTENRDPILGIIVINPNFEAIGETKITSQNYTRIRPGDRWRRVGADEVGDQQPPRQSVRVLSERPYASANPFSQTQPDPITGKLIPDTKRNQFGGSLGGPIRRDRVFIFGDFQGTRSKVGGSRLLTVPTEAARRGNLALTARTSTIR